MHRLISFFWLSNFNKALFIKKTSVVRKNLGLESALDSTELYEVRPGSGSGRTLRNVLDVFGPKMRIIFFQFQVAGNLCSLMQTLTSCQKC